MSNNTSIPVPVFNVPDQEIYLEDLVEEIYLSDLIAELNPPPYVHVPHPYTGTIGWDE